ncbi:MAG TPA: protein kinase, partial [Thermoanaerobaculia bacterium]|nr:protein kinase [Thermoanaerobaculia bacterium]
SAFCSGCGARLDPPSTIAGGRYQLGRLLGEGATKRVYSGRDLRLDREVAIAFVSTATLDQAGRVRIEREAQAMARLGDHPNVVTVYDVLEESGAIYVITQLMSGGDLATRIAQHPGGRLGIEEAVAIAVQICRALEHAHGRGIVHRDLKPANVWLTGDTTAKLGDFGLAVAADQTRVTAPGTIVGTVDYMAPEQVLGKPADVRSDLYALGATLYKMLTGQAPFTADDPIAVLSQHLHTPPVAPSFRNADVPRGLELVILDLLAKDPAARPAGAAIVRGRLQAVTSTPMAASAPIAAPAPNPLDRLAGGVYVGRTAEVARLRRLFEDTLSGSFRLLLVAGEPGIGKTRTVEELVTYARMRGAEALWGRCQEDRGAPPFWPWLQIVRAWIRDREPRELLATLGPGASDLASAVPELHEILPGLAPPPPLDAEQERFRLFESAVALLRGAALRRPLLVVLDDLHWADEASLLLLQFVARELGPARLLLVGTYRDLELRRRHPLAETLAELARVQGVERVQLRGLSAEDIGSFIAQTAAVEPPRALVEAVHRQTEGNPFFVQEVVRLLAAEGRLERMRNVDSWSLEIPQGVREVIGRRLNRLSAGANETLAVASVLGRELDLATLKRVSQRPEDVLLAELEEALAARIFEPASKPGRYRFAHALVQETLYEELSAPRRAVLHRTAAEALEERHGAAQGAHLVAIALHRFEAASLADRERAIEACERAARWSTANRAWEEAALQLSRAVQLVELGDHTDPVRLCELMVSLSEAQVLSRDSEGRRATALRAAELAREIGSAVHLARAALVYGANLGPVELGRVDPAMTGLLEEAIAALGDGEPALRARLLLQLARELFFSSDFERIGRLIDAAGRLAEEIGDTALQADVIWSGMFSVQVGREHELLDRSREMVELARRGGDLEAEARAWAAVVKGATFLGDREAALRGMAEQARVVEELRLPMPRYVLRLQEAMWMLLEGRHDEFPEAVRRMRDDHGEMAVSPNGRQWLGSQFFVASRQRRSPLAIEPARELVERFPAYPIYRAFLCGVYLSQGEVNEARRTLAVLASDLGSVPRDNNWLPTMVLAADAAAELEEPRAAAALYDLLRPFAGLWPGIGPMVVCFGPVDLRLARLAAVLGRVEDARVHLEAAMAGAVRMESRPYVAETRLAMAALDLAAGGEPGEAHTLPSGSPPPRASG